MDLAGTSLINPRLLPVIMMSRHNNENLLLFSLAEETERSILADTSK